MQGGGRGGMWTNIKFNTLQFRAGHAMFSEKLYVFAIFNLHYCTLLDKEIAINRRVYRI